MSDDGENGVSDWQEYFSKSNRAWCWASKSRGVTYFGASRSQQAVFKAGWVVLPPPSDDKHALPQYLNIFSGEQVSDRADIPEFVHPSGTTGTKKRLRPANDEADEAEEDQKKAAAHYNHLERKREDRGRGSVARMRALNNWVKAVLIDGQLSPLPTNSVSVLELACGKGGDFFKIRNACPRGSHLTYVGVDIAQQSLEEFVRRFRENRGAGGNRGGGASSASVRLACANLGTHRLHGDPAPDLAKWDADTDARVTGPAFHSQDQFDVVSMQFALHYMCQSSERLSRFFASWSANLVSSLPPPWTRML